MLPSDSQPAEPVITPPPLARPWAHAAADDDASMYVLENGTSWIRSLPSTGYAKLAAENGHQQTYPALPELQRYREEETAPAGAQEQHTAEVLPTHQMSGEQHVC